MNNNQQKPDYISISTNGRLIKSDVGQVRFTMWNDVIQLSFGMATGKDNKNNITYNNDPKKNPNVKMSYGVAAAIAELIRKEIYPAAVNNIIKSVQIKTYMKGSTECYLEFNISNGRIELIGKEAINGQLKQCSYNFPPTLVKVNGQDMNVQGEVLAFANTLDSFSMTGFDVKGHIEKYNNEVKSKFASAQYNKSQGNFNSIPF